MATTFNPADQNAFVTLSNGNLTATGNSGSNGGVRGTSSHGPSTGKFTLQFTNVTINGDLIDYIGIGSLADTLGLANGSQPNQIIMISDGLIFDPANNGAAGGTDVRVGTHTIDFAFDFVNALVWIRGDGGDWNDTTGGDPTNPSTGHGVAMGSLTAALFPYVRLTSSASFCTINPSPGFTLTGYQSWDAGNVWASVESPDIFAAIGFPGFGSPHGSLFSTEAKDTFAGTGFPHIVGVMTVTEFPDAFSAFGRQPLTAVWNSTEAPDRFNAAGVGRGENGVFITTEAVDILTIIGHTPFAGTFVTTEAADRFNAIGAGVVRARRRRVSFVT